MTDSETEVVYREGKDGINNLMTIYASITGKTYDEIAQEFAGKGYGDFKVCVGQCVADELKPVREEYARLMQDKKYVEEMMKKGAENAGYVASRTLNKVKKKVGLYL